MIPSTHRSGVDIVGGGGDQGSLRAAGEEGQGRVWQTEVCDIAVGGGHITMLNACRAVPFSNPMGWGVAVRTTHPMGLKQAVVA